MTVPAYETVAQEVYWGSDKGLTDIGQDMLGIPILSDLSATQRVALGKEFPQVFVGRANYRATAQAMVADAAADAFGAEPEAIFAAIQTDAMTAMVMDAVVTGLPRTAAAQGVITASVPIAPGGDVYRCKAEAFDGAGNVTVGNTDTAFVVVASGASGNIVRGTDTKTVTKPAILTFDGTGTTVAIPARLTGWVLAGTVVEV